MSKDRNSRLEPQIAQYYELGKEAARLGRGSNQLERLRTEELLGRYLPSTPAKVYDIGGGPGFYALGLAQQGYRVHLLDAMALHVEQASAASHLQSPFSLESVVLGDARHLPFPDSSAGAVLLLGPLYHLTTLEDRLQALREAYRVLEPGGVVFAAGINRFASSLEGLFYGLYADPAYRVMADQDLLDGQHRNPDDKAYFTTAYFHHPLELKAEILSAGFALETLVALEGVGNLLPDFDAHWADPEKREWILHLARRLETEITLLGVSMHTLAVGRKQSG